MFATATRPSDSGEDDRPMLVATTLSCTLAALFVFSLRAFARIRIVCSFGWDDAVMCFAMLLSLTGAGFILAEAYYGGGRHVSDITPAAYTMGLKMNTISMPIYVVAIATVKISVGFALMRIAGHTRWRYLILTTMVIMGFWAFSTIFTISLQCNPPSRRWDSTVDGTCWPPRVTQALGYTDATLNITTDIIFAILIPVPLFYNLNISPRRRIYLITVLGLGVFACIACIIKTVHLDQIAEYSDFLWDSCHVTIWVTVEVNTGIVAGSIPAVKPCVTVLMGYKTPGPDRHKKITGLSLSTIGSHRRSWRKLTWPAASGVTSSSEPIISHLVLEDGGMYPLEEFLGSRGLTTSRTTSHDRADAVQEGDEGASPVETIRKSRPTSRIAEDLVVNNLI